MYSQTNLQLYNQLIEKNYASKDLKLIKKAYELSTRLFAGRFQRSGKDFISHNVGTASILCAHDFPPEMVTAGLLHNVYGNGNFGFSDNGLKRKRKFMFEHLGVDIEKYLFGFYKINYIHKKNWRRVYLNNPQVVKSIEEIDKKVLLILLADILEHNLYSGYNVLDDGKSLKTTIKFIKENSQSIIKLAQLLGYPNLADELEKNFKKIINDKIHPLFEKNTNHINVIVPKSYNKKYKLIFNENKSKFLKQTTILKKLLKTITPK